MRELHCNWCRLLTFKTGQISLAQLCLHYWPVHECWLFISYNLLGLAFLICPWDGQGEMSNQWSIIDLFNMFVSADMSIRYKLFYNWPFCFWVVYLINDLLLTFLLQCNLFIMVKNQEGWRLLLYSPEVCLGLINYPNTLFVIIILVDLPLTCMYYYMRKYHIVVKRYNQRTKQKN